MKHERHAVYSVSQPASWSQFDISKYSKFKYGCPTSTCFFARQLAEEIVRHLDLSHEWMITSAAYKQMPTASAHLLDLLLHELQPRSIFKSFGIRRKQIYATDFASLNPSARFRLIQQVDLVVNQEHIDRKSVVVIDDAYVSGAHEENILRLFNRRPKEVQFFYLVDLSGFHQLTTEEKLNQAAIKKLDDLQGLMSGSGFLLNARILKFLLGYSDLITFQKFIQEIDPVLLDRIYMGILADGYHQLSAYQVNFTIIQMQVMRSRSLNSVHAVNG